MAGQPEKLTLEVEVTNARTEDAPAIQDVIKEAWLATYPNEEAGITREDIEQATAESHSKKRIDNLKDAIVNKPNFHVFVAKDDDHVVGLVGIYNNRPRKDGSKVNGVKFMYVLPGYQNKGVGKSLMLKAFEWFDNDQATVLEVVEYNKRAIEFYKKFGFEIQGPTKSQAGTLPNGKVLPELWMKKTHKSFRI